VLLLAQILSFALHMHERGELLAQVSGMQSAQRIADIVKLLDPLSPEERVRIAPVLSAPPLTIRLGQAPLAARNVDADKAARGALFGTMVRRFLPEGRAVTVSVTEGGPFKPGAMYALKGYGEKGDWVPPMMRHGQTSGLALIAQVPLQDGTLVTFDTRQTQAAASWPYRLLASLAVLLVAVVAVSFLAVRWVTRPLKTLADAAEELGKNIDHPPLREQGPLEVVRAARAFNTMQARLAGFIRDRTRVLAAMSHDLKTPITRLRLRAELLDDAQQRAKFTDNLQELESMVGATLDYLRGMESGEPRHPVDVGALLESLQLDLQEAGATVSIEGAPRGPYPGGAQALKRCLGNLLDNAVQYGKSAHIVVDDSAARLEIRIEDEGPGLGQDDLEKVFEPYYRAEPSRNRDTGGTGLGLTIARSVAEAHGGQIRLRNRDQGGLEVTLTLPRNVA